MRGIAAALGLIGLLLTGSAARGATLLCSLDVGGNGVPDALTDGLLIMRDLFGFTGETLTEGALGSGCTRCTGADIAAYLDSSDCAGMLDVDGDGAAAPLTDGLLAIRYLFGFRGETLMDGAVGSEARTDALTIETHLAYYAGTRTETLADTLLPGEQATSDSGLATLENTGGNAVGVQVIEGTDEAGNPVLEIEVDGEGIELILPDPNQLSTLKLARRAGAPEAAANALQPYVITERWERGWGWFSLYSEVSYNRLPGWRATTPIPIPIVDLSVFVALFRTHELMSACAESEAACYSGKEAVLFIHGFSLRGLGGGEGTWADFPRLLKEAGDYVPFEFRWNTAARFQDVARDLGDAIDTIRAQTGRPVHLVAHSFGGLLVRTLLQGWNLDGAHSDIAASIANVSTLGTPHSGIADQDECLHGLPVPQGQDTYDNIDLFEGCGQLSCHQAGEYCFDPLSAPYYGVSDEPGELIAGLDDVATLPAVDFLVLMGLTTRRNENDIVDPGDALITYEGQRFLPGDSIWDPTGGCGDEQLLEARWEPPRDSAVVGAAHVSERVLGFPDTLRPNDENPDPTSGGYRHSSAVDAQDESEEQPPAEAEVCSARTFQAARTTPSWRYSAGFRGRLRHRLQYPSTTPASTGAATTPPATTPPAPATSPRRRTAIMAAMPPTTTTAMATPASASPSWMPMGMRCRPAQPSGAVCATTSPA
jgi:pimeloyl-ACP methyl ester carboxylesterase